MPVGLLADGSPDRPGHLALEPLGRRHRGVLDVDREALALGHLHRAVAQEGRDRGRVERRGQHRQPEVGAPSLRAPGQRQHQVAPQVALVKLVDHHHAELVGPAIAGGEAPGQEALGHEHDAGVGADPAIEAHFVADRAAHPGAQLGSDPRGRSPRRQPPRLQHRDPPAPRHAGLEQGRREPRGLARAGRRHHHQIAAGERVGRLGQVRIDRERRADHREQG